MAIKSGGKVNVESNVGIVPDSKVKVDGKPPLQDGRVSLPDSRARPRKLGEKALKREVTVFNFVQLDGNRSIVRGWNFPSGCAGASPTTQFCCLSVDSKGRSQRIDTDNRDSVVGFDGLVAKMYLVEGISVMPSEENRGGKESLYSRCPHREARSASSSVAVTRGHSLPHMRQPLRDIAGPTREARHDWRAKANN